MKFADEILKNKEIKRQEEFKKHVELVNTELLEIEKAISKYEADLEDKKMYIDIPMIIKTKEAKDSLKEHKFYIDKVNQNIPYGTTRLYLNETSYNDAIAYAEHVSKRMPYRSMCDPFGVKEAEEKDKNLNNKKLEKIDKHLKELFGDDFRVEWL